MSKTREAKEQQKAESKARLEKKLSDTYGKLVEAKRRGWVEPARRHEAKLVTYQRWYRKEHGQSWAPSMIHATHECRSCTWVGNADSGYHHFMMEGHETRRARVVA